VVSGTIPADSLMTVASSSAITVPAGVTAAVGANSWILAEGNTVDIPYTFSLDSRYGASVSGTGEITAGSYGVALERFNWLTNHAGGGRETSTFMAGNSAWRTGNVTMP